MSSHPDIQPVNLLWTGGWDSTFRLLDLAICRRHPVQPWYVLDRERASTPTEVATMKRIRNTLAQRDPEAASLVSESIHVELGSIRPSPEIDALHATTTLGSQYGWLPRFAKQWGLEGLELGSVAVEGGRMYELLRNNVETIVGSAGDSYRVVANPADERARLFARFSFPILMLSKDDLRRQAEARGFLDLMHLTWTCHSPRNGAPCGACAPCLVTIRSGQGWRIPVSRRLRPMLRLAKAAVLKHRRVA